MSRFVLCALGVWLGSSCLAQSLPKPQSTISLASALKCKAKEHTAHYVRFSPFKDLLAVVLQDYGFWAAGDSQPKPWHLVVASLDGSDVRHLIYYEPKKQGVFLPKKVSPDRFEFLNWSPDAGYIAVQTSLASMLIRVADGRSCQLPPGGVGFIEGPRYVFNVRSRDESTGPMLNFFNMDCSLVESLPSPSFGLGTALPDGTKMALRAHTTEPILLLTDLLGNSVREVPFRIPRGQYEPDLIRGITFVDSARAFCFTETIAAESIPRCFDLRSGERIPVPVDNYSPSASRQGVVASWQASRIAWAVDMPGKADEVGDALGTLQSTIDNRRGGKMPRPPWWIVWDLQAKKELLRLPPVWQKRLINSDFETRVALSPAGDYLVWANKEQLMIFPLPPE